MQTSSPPVPLAPDCPATRPPYCLGAHPLHRLAPGLERASLQWPRGHPHWVQDSAAMSAARAPSKEWLPSFSRVCFVLLEVLLPGRPLCPLSAPEGRCPPVRVVLCPTVSSQSRAGTQPGLNKCLLTESRCPQKPHPPNGGSLWRVGWS